MVGLCIVAFADSKEVISQHKPWMFAWGPDPHSPDSKPLPGLHWRQHAQWVSWAGCGLGPGSCTMADDFEEPVLAGDSRLISLHSWFHLEEFPRHILQRWLLFKEWKLPPLGIKWAELHSVLVKEVLSIAAQSMVFSERCLNGFNFDFFYFQITVFSPLYFGFHSAESYFVSGLTWWHPKRTRVRQPTKPTPPPLFLGGAARALPLLSFSHGFWTNSLHPFVFERDCPMCVSLTLALSQPVLCCVRKGLGAYLHAGIWEWGSVNKWLLV